MDVEFGSGTDVGAVRERNEDAVLAVPPLFAVADGMGGHAAGDVASRLALTRLSTACGRPGVRPEDLLAAIDAANDAIMAFAEQHLEALGMGTTLSGICLGDVAGSAHWLVFNVGDSRVYRLANGVLAQVTTDHSEVQELLTEGRITAEEARVHPLRNVVTRSLGTRPAPVPDVWVLPMQPGETFLVCSDGLPLEVSDEEIAGVLGRGLAPQQAADALVAMAVQAGGRDNVSAVVVAVPVSPAADLVEVTTAPRRGLARGAA